MSYNIEQYLTDQDIEYWSAGKNVTSGWINIQCPFCVDSANHCGISLKSSMFNCWICGEKGHIKKIVTKIENTSFKKASYILKKYQTEDFEEEEIEEHYEPITNIIPKYFTTNFPNKHLNYLLSRNFNPTNIIKKYKLLSCHNLGNYRYRIIAPVIYQNKIVNFVARDITGKAEQKYKYPANKDSIIPINSTIYNLDNVSDSVVICEGITDVWRLGNNAISIHGKIITKNQIELLLIKEITAVTIILDGDAVEQAENMAEQLSGVIDNVNIIELDGCDPAELSEIEVNELKKSIYI